MPVNPALKNLARDGRFSLDDAKALKQLVARGTVSEAEAKETLKRYGEVMDPEAGSLLESFTGGSRGGTMTSLPEEMLASTCTIGCTGGDVSVLQKALMAVGMREQNPAITMPSGVDGIFGVETKAAVKAFQEAHGIAPTGKADPATMRLLDQTLKGDRRPPSTTPLPPAPTGTAPRPTRGLGGPAPTAPVPDANGVVPATPGAVVDAAQRLVDGPTSKNYGVDEKWINSDPRHAAPTGKGINGTADKWKCNLFAGNVIANAGFEPPYYGDRRSGGEYPNANQLYKWSDKYASKFGTQPRFHLGDEVRDMPKMTPEARKARMDQLLAKLQPGDLLIVDHLGDGVRDGGHCRVFLGMDDNGKYKFAQASHDGAVVKAQDESDIDNEEHAWILRPNVPRK